MPEAPSPLFVSFSDWTVAPQQALVLHAGVSVLLCGPDARALLGTGDDVSSGPVGEQHDKIEHVH